MTQSLLMASISTIFNIDFPWCLDRSRGLKDLYWVIPSSILTIEVKKIIWGSAKYHAVLLQLFVQGLDSWLPGKSLSPVSLGSKFH